MASPVRFSRYLAQYSNGGGDTCGELHILRGGTGMQVEIATATARQCLEWDPNPETRAATEALLDGKHDDALVKAFGKRIAFGTAGLRGEMAAGTANMNDLVVIQAAQGLCRYLEAQYGDRARSMGLVLGYDHRKRGSISSKNFALLTAAVFTSQGFHVHLFRHLVATPIVPWTVDQVGAAAGVMVTASHNPKNDDGYKVYWTNGAQIIPPHDEGIAASINANLAPWAAYDVSHIESHELVHDPEAVIAKYHETVATKLCRFREFNAASTEKIVYTAMHGVGTPFTARQFEAFGLRPFEGVEQQIEPDPEFPTVKFPNPEEGAGALALAMAKADAVGARLILANDPDADRLAVAERNDSGWKIFTGNEIGTLLGHWEWTQWRRANPDADPKNVMMLASTVSSKMLAAIARKEGFGFEDTLTGFKWLGNAAAHYRAAGKIVPFSYEEAIGFCVGDIVKDKDGVCAAAVFAEMALQIYASGKTVLQHYQYLQDTYGYFVANNRYVFCYDPVLTAKVFNRLRNEGHYWLKCGRFPIASIRDLTVGVDTSRSDLRPTLPTDATTHMITYSFANGCVATLRTSGTEPKIKYYIEVHGATRDSAQALLDEIAPAIIEEMIEPGKNGLSGSA